jgi:hypothetical protein
VLHSLLYLVVRLLLEVLTVRGQPAANGGDEDDL